MKLLADESVDFGLIKYLREVDKDIISIAEQDPGIDDEGVLSKAFDSERTLITADKDFGMLAFSKRKKSCGIILLRFQSIPLSERKMILKEVLEKYYVGIAESFIFISIDNIRIRSLSS